MGEECSTHCYQFHTHLKICLTHLLDNVSHCERTRDLRIQARIRPTQNCADNTFTRAENYHTQHIRSRSKTTHLSNVHFTLNRVLLFQIISLVFILSTNKLLSSRAEISTYSATWRVAGAKVSSSTPW